MSLCSLIWWYCSELMWPNVEHLALATNIPGQVLVDLLRQHAAISKSLELSDMLVHHVDSAIEQIPRVDRLACVYIECLWTDAGQGSSIDFIYIFPRGTYCDDSYERAVKARLLAQPKACPLIEWDGSLGNVDDWTDDEQERVYASEEKR